MSNNFGIMGIVPEISNTIRREEVFALEQLTLFRNLFSDATGVASLIRYPVMIHQ